MSQLPQRLRLDLADALTRHVKLGTHLFQRALSPIFKAEAETQHALLTRAAPCAVGSVLALWVVAPITEQLGIGHVITRAILATGIGATLWFVVLGLTGVVTAVSATSDVLGIAASPGLIGAQLGYALQQALTGLVVLLPLGVLGGVLQWVWRTAHPAPHHIEGLIDV